MSAEVSSRAARDAAMPHRSSRRAGAAAAPPHEREPRAPAVFRAAARASARGTENSARREEQKRLAAFAGALRILAGKHIQNPLANCTRPFRFKLNKTDTPPLSILIIHRGSVEAVLVYLVVQYSYAV